MYTNIEELFEPYAEKLNKLASDHNLEVKKWNRNLPHWMFSFQHPKGGVGRVDIQINNQKEVFLSKYWTVDDYDKLTRRINHEPGKKIDNPLERLEGKMIEAIKEIVEWDEGRLKQKGGIARGTAMEISRRHVYPKPVL